MPGTIYSDLITTNALPDAIRIIYSQELEFTSRPTLIYDQPAFVETRDDFGAKRGNQVIWTIYHQLPPSIAPLSQNQDITGGTIQDHQVSFTVSEYGDAIGTTELLDLVSYHGPISNIVRTLLAPSQALTFDTLCRNMFWNANNNNLMNSNKVGVTYHYYTGNVNSRYAMDPSVSLLTSDVVKAAALRLSVRRIPTIGAQNPSYVCITHPAVINDLRSDPYWKDAQLYAGATNIFTGEEGMIHGVRFIKSDRARIANGGNYLFQTTLSASYTPNVNSVTVASVSGFNVGDEVTLHHTGVAATQGANSWIAPDGQDPTNEELIIQSINTTTNTLTFTNSIMLPHAVGDYVTKAQDVYPMVIQGGLAAVGKGVVVPPEVRVSLPTDKLRRMSYVGWYSIVGYGVIRDWAYDLVETLATTNIAPPFGF